MVTSTLDPDNIPLGPDRSVGGGHGTGALGPSDTSDSGSDVRGGVGLADDAALDDADLARVGGMNDDPEMGTAGGTAGPDLGDADLDSDSDANGTGERAAAGRDSVTPDGADIGFDRVGIMPEDGVEGGDDDDVEDVEDDGDEGDDVDRDPTRIDQRLLH
ncbi:hypothetical protein [Rugamonas sp.]|uniref:hypothetical protein n=1 Tax=Rugamonas sp. TaxID=1926287 RepID=UPI0025EC42F4|nr:hypothetical protein [Rugamonas sp.]